MDAAAAEDLDDLLSELPETDAAPGELLVVRDQAEDVPRGRVRVEPEEKVGRRQVEEAQRMRLDPLCERDEPAQLLGGLRDLDRKDVVAGLGGGDQVAGRADAADAGGDASHFPHAAGPRRTFRSRGIR